MTNLSRYDARTRYALIAGKYAADAIDLAAEANTLTGKDREIAELCATAARELSRWHAAMAHKSTRISKTEEGA